MLEQDTLDPEPEPAPPPSLSDEPSLDEEGQGVAPLMEAALAWVRENQTLAMLGAFAAGVFVGVLMRR